MTNQIDEKITLFKEDIKSQKLSPEEVFQKHIIDGNSFFYEVYQNDLDSEYKAKKTITDFLITDINNIRIIGSAKLGYSLKPNNLFKLFDAKYEETNQNKDKSDIDIAIIDDIVFERISKKLFEYTNSYSMSERWSENEYYNGNKLDRFEGIPLCFKYFEYYTKGWFRPDMKPQGFEICDNSNYEELKKIFFMNHKRKISLAIYKNWFYFKDYHLNNIKSLSFRIQSEVI
ncbi:MAG: hypothetical protein KDC73_12615 [Ignavibacteriae bacterium]|nr:hypothetical protein [Ignavibacteriota bacterium]MCB9242895.1 hypothetical protein [Ignavibacteriales bacterium]